MTAAAPALLNLRDISKSFTGVAALRGINLTIHAGQVHTLLGENGAGKSTLIKILAGVHQADSGTMLLDGTPYRPPTHGKRQRTVSPWSFRNSACATT